MSDVLTSRGQVTIPKWVRDGLGVAPGDSVDFHINDRGETVIKKACAEKPGPDGRFAHMRGFFGPGLTTNEIMALTRGEPD